MKLLSMNTQLGLSIVGLLLLNGCTTIPMESKEISIKAKSFNLPSRGNAGLYIYRDSMSGLGLKKDIWVDDKCIGESAPHIFFYEDIKGDTWHTISTESEFSPNNLFIKTESGKNYFIRQYIKIGVLINGANLELIEEAEAKKSISQLDMAKKGTCSKQKFKD